MRNQKLSDITGILPDSRKYVTVKDFVLSRCPIGIEIEMEGITNRIQADTEQLLPRRVPIAPRPQRLNGNYVSPYWRLTSDGSLRNNGVELISDPIWGEDINAALDSLQEIIARSGNTPEFSERTSVHIHLDVRSLTTLQLFNLLVLVVIFERTLVRYCGGSREENIFCLPFYKAEYSMAALSKITDTNTDFLHNLDNTFKYNGFNIKPVGTQGSVEFRYHYGTMDKERLKEWINIIYCIKREAVKIEDILTLPDTISVLGADSYVTRVFGKYAKLLSTDNFMGDMYEGIRLAQELIYAERQNNQRKECTHYGRLNVVAARHNKPVLLPTVEAITHRKIDDLYHTDLFRQFVQANLTVTPNTGEGE